MGISIFSYNGGVTVGLQVAAGIVPDPDTIIADYEREVETLRQLVARPRKQTPRAGSIQPAQARHRVEHFSRQPPATTMRRRRPSGMQESARVTCRRVGGRRACDLADRSTPCGADILKMRSFRVRPYAISRMARRPASAIVAAQR